MVVNRGEREQGEDELVKGGQIYGERSRLDLGW